MEVISLYIFIIKLLARSNIIINVSLFFLERVLLKFINLIVQNTSSQNKKKHSRIFKRQEENVELLFKIRSN